MIISGQSTEDTIPDVGTTLYMLSLLASIRIYSNVKDYKTENKTLVDTEYERENGISLDFNFVLLPNPAKDMNWVC